MGAMVEDQIALVRGNKSDDKGERAWVAMGVCEGFM